MPDLLTFWNSCNFILRANGLSEMLYGEARGQYEDFLAYEAAKPPIVLKTQNAMSLTGSYPSESR
jgi:hypothetical protein